MKQNYQGFDLSDETRAKLDKKKKFRKSEMDLPQKIYVTEEVHTILRKQKRKQKKSMARIVCDLVLNAFKKA